MILKTKTYELDGRELTAHYRPGTSDEDVLREVVDRQSYARRSVGFDVLPGESWLDLGANIGAFVIYAALRGAAHVHAFEPMPDCFELLEKNARACRPAMIVALSKFVVTNRKDTAIPFYTKNNPLNHWRGTIVEVQGYEKVGELPNVYAGDLGVGFDGAAHYDGVKMDIEGSELGIIDDDLIPPCSKLVMEYHICRDERNLPRFRRRMAKLRKRFKNVRYPASVEKEKLPEWPGLYQGRFDFLVHCWGVR